MRIHSLKQLIFTVLTTLSLIGCRAAPPAVAPTPPATASNGGVTASPTVSSTETGSTITGQIYADNYFQMWVNGQMVADDPIPVMPHNTVTVNFKAQYPITIAIRAEDSADPTTGLEYDNTRIGDAGLIAKFSDGTVTNIAWKCKAFFSAPLNRDCVNNDPVHTCKSSRKEIPSNWFAANFDDSSWKETKVYAENVVKPDGDYGQYKWGNAQFIWTGDLEIDNTVLCRYTINAPSANTSATQTISQSTKFELKSPQVVEGEALPKDYTCDGSSATLPLDWNNAPSGTQSFAVVMHHIPGPGDSHWYWVLYNIPSNVKSLPQNVKGIGTLGNNSVNSKTEYTPPCSKGPGAKIYTYTVYALSAPPQFTVAPSKVTRDVLLAAIKDRTLASAELNVTYSR